MFSKYVKHIHTAVNETARIVTGCLKHNPVHNLYPLIGITPPHILREVTANIERKKKQNDQKLVLSVATNQQINVLGLAKVIFFILKHWRVRWRKIVLRGVRRSLIRYKI